MILIEKKKLPNAHQIFSYQKVVWTKGPFGKKPRKRTISMVKSGGPNHFVLYNGFWKKLNDLGINISYERLKPKSLPKIPLRLKDWQKKAATISLKSQRGVIEAPMGSGKTALAAAIISCFHNRYNIVFIVQKIDLLLQTKSKFQEMGIDCFSIGAGNKRFQDGICVATIQTLSKLKPDVLGRIDGIIIDECHHGISNSFFKVVEIINPKMALGLTATPPRDPERKMKLEALLGPIIFKESLGEAIDGGALSKPKVTIVNYGDVSASDTNFQNSVANTIKNATRNAAIVKIAKERNLNKKSCLILITRIEHGENIKALSGFDFICGITPAKTREQMKDLFEKKKKKTVISTVWGQGVDITTLDVVIIAAGGKSDITLLQNIGRGLRTTKTKKTMEIIDFIDTDKYGATHLAHRMKVYAENNWPCSFYKA